MLTSRSRTYYDAVGDACPPLTSGTILSDQPANAQDVDWAPDHNRQPTWRVPVLRMLERGRYWPCDFTDARFASGGQQQRDDCALLRDW